MKPKMYKGNLFVKCIWTKGGKVSALALTRPLWYGGEQVLRLWPLEEPVSLEAIRKRKFYLDELFGSVGSLNTKNRKERRK